MEKKYFFSNAEILHYFPNALENELVIQLLGYHNFKYIPAEHIVRQQTCHTLHFIISGKGYLTVNGKSFTVEKNDVFYLNDKDFFTYYPDKDEPWEYIFFELNGNLISKYANEIGFTSEKPIKKSFYPNNILTMLKKVFKTDNFSPSYYIANSFFNLVLDSVYDNKISHYATSEKIIADVKSLINLKYSFVDFNLEYICNAIHVSHSHLCRIFKKKENITPVQYLNNIKINHAKELLINTNKTVYEICFNVGYNEYEYFLRLFKKMTGLTPLLYRIRYTKKNNIE